MYSKFLNTAAVAVGSLMVPVLASAAVVTINPSATNGGTPVDSTTAAFQATGGTLQLGTSAAPSTLVVASNTGVATFTESGTIFVTTFTNGITNTNVGAGNYTVYASYTSSGVGAWTGNVYTVGSSVINMTLFAKNNTTNAVTTLGTAAQLGTPTNYAFAILSGLPAVNTSGSANSVLGTTLGFTPAAGTTGINGFWQAPNPFAININIGSIGGNSGNTTYTVSAAGVVTVSTPQAGTSPSTGNFTFTNVPEPGALSLAGIALLGLGFASRRKASKTTA